MPEETVEFSERLDAIGYLFTHGIVPIIVAVGLITWGLFCWHAFTYNRALKRRYKRR